MVSANLPTSNGIDCGADNMLQGYSAADQYLNDFLTEDGKYPPLSLLTEEHIEGNHLASIVEDSGRWFTMTWFKTKSKTWLSNKSKSEYYGKQKELWREKFKGHPLWKDTEWWTELQSLFNKACERSWLDEDNVVGECKCEPLDRDLRGGSGGILRQKYMDVELVDAVLVAKLMIQVGTLSSVRHLIKFNLWCDACQFSKVEVP